MPQFLIIATDFGDADALARRMENRNNHLDRLKVHRQLGNYVCGGAISDEAGTMRGSMLVVNMENKKVVQQWLAQDPYVLGKVWDTITVESFRMAEV